MDIKDVVTKLVGPIDPVGETHIDEHRFENLEHMTELINDLFKEINGVARFNKHRVEHSMNKAGKHCDKFLKMLHSELEEYGYGEKS